MLNKTKLSNVNIMVLLVLFIIFTAIVLAIVYIAIRTNQPTIKSFSIVDYQFYIDSFPSNETIGSFSDSKELLQKVESVWIDIYGKDVISREKPYQLFYDETSAIWLVCGTLHSEMGGVANILIEDGSGKIVAVWHDK